MPFGRDRDTWSFPLVAARSAARRACPAAVPRPLGVVRWPCRAGARGLRAADWGSGGCGRRSVGGGGVDRIKDETALFAFSSFRRLVLLTVACFIYSFFSLPDLLLSFIHVI